MMIHNTDNICSICLTENLKWHINICKSDMQMFKCGHGTCKSCYIKLKNNSDDFSCPLCRGHEQLYSTGFGTNKTEKWTTFAEWYNDFEIYITSGAANNIIKNTAFGKQLLRLYKENKHINLRNAVSILQQPSKTAAIKNSSHQKRS